MLKTSIAANLSGLVAASGWKVLLIDTDPQGNLARDLGYIEQSDDGQDLYDAVTNARPPTPLRDVRPNLDVVAGGDRIQDLQEWWGAQASKGGVSHYRSFEASLSPIAGEYQLIVIDTPPNISLAHTVLWSSAHYLIIPTQPDDGSLDGFGKVFSQIRDVRAMLNPYLEVLGVALGPVASSGTAIKREVRSDLHDMLNEDVPVFESTIRLAQKPARDARKHGLLVGEMAAAVELSPKWYEKLRDKDAKKDANKSGKKQKGSNEVSFAQSARSLAKDYQALTTEVMERFADRQRAYAELMNDLARKGA